MKREIFIVFSGTSVIYQVCEWTGERFNRGKAETVRNESAEMLAHRLLRHGHANAQLFVARSAGQRTTPEYRSDAGALRKLGFVVNVIKSKEYDDENDSLDCLVGNVAMGGTGASRNCKRS